LKNYATKCPHKNESKKISRGETSETLASKFKIDFTLIICMVSTIMRILWYLDLGASFHMTGCREFFSDLEENYLQMHIDMGNEGRYTTIDVDTITFQRESRSPLTLKDVMLVPCLKKNIIYVVVLEDHGYDVIFNKGKEFLRHNHWIGEAY